MWDECCWICLDETDHQFNKLIKPCKCPRVAHQFCIAKWQLASKTHKCTFCRYNYPHWKHLTNPKALQPYYYVPDTLFFELKINSQLCVLPIQTCPHLNSVAVLQALTLLSGSQTDYASLKCTLTDPFTNESLIVYGKAGLFASVHFVLLQNAYSGWKKHESKFWTRAIKALILIRDMTIWLARKFTNIYS